MAFRSISLVFAMVVGLTGCSVTQKEFTQGQAKIAYKALIRQVNDYCGITKRKQIFKGGIIVYQSEDKVNITNIKMGSINFNSKMNFLEAYFTYETLKMKIITLHDPETDGYWVGCYSYRGDKHLSQLNLPESFPEFLLRWADPDFKPVQLLHHEVWRLKARGGLNFP